METYEVKLVRTPSFQDCSTVDATLTTNSAGNGGVLVSEAIGAHNDYKVGPWSIW